MKHFFKTYLSNWTQAVQGCLTLM